MLSRSCRRLLFLCTVQYLSACGSENSPQGTWRESSDLLPLASLLRAESHIRLYPSYDDPIGTAGDLLVVDSQFIVFDVMQANLKVFDYAGKLIRTIGRSGDGPGEFRRPMSGTVLANERFAVLDETRRVVSIRDSTGRTISEWYVGGSKLYSVGSIEGNQGIVLTGRLNTVASSPDLLTKDRGVHEYDFAGSLVASYRPVPKPKHHWEEMFSGTVLASLGDIVVSGSYSSNRIHHYERSSGKEWWTDIGGLWYKPLEWPDDDESSNVSKAVQVTSWAKQQILLTRLYSIDETHYLAQFQAYDSDDNRVFHYLLADVSGKTLAITKATSLKILHVIAGVPYGIELGEDGAVTIVVLALNRTFLEDMGP